MIVLGTKVLDLKLVSLNLNELSSILTTNYTSLLTNGEAGLDDLYITLSPVLNP